MVLFIDRDHRVDYIPNWNASFKCLDLYAVYQSQYF